jgi:hypothetical protein
MTWGQRGRTRRRGEWGGSTGERQQKAVHACCKTKNTMPSGPTSEHVTKLRTLLEDPFITPTAGNLSVFLFAVIVLIPMQRAE